MKQCFSLVWLPIAKFFTENVSFFIIIKIYFILWLKDWDSQKYDNTSEQLKCSILSHSLLSMSHEVLKNLFDNEKFIA